MVQSIITCIWVFFSVVVWLEAPDEWFILWTPGWIMTPVNYFQIQEVLSLTVSDSLLCIRVHLTQKKTKKKFKVLILNVMVQEKVQSTLLEFRLKSAFGPKNLSYNCVCPHLRQSVMVSTPRKKNILYFYLFNQSNPTISLRNRN